MKSLLFASALLLAAAVPGVTPAKETTILPGYWLYTNSISLFLTQTSVEHRCVKPDEVDKMLAGPSNRHYKCDYPTRVVGDGKARFEGVCRDKHGREAQVSAVGTYAPKSFHLDAKLTTSIIAGIPLTPTGVIDAKWLSADCPAPDAKPAASE